jgi:hypothetical protein
MCGLSSPRRLLESSPSIEIKGVSRSRLLVGAGRHVGLREEAAAVNGKNAKVKGNSASNMFASSCFRIRNK